MSETNHSADRDQPSDFKDSTASDPAKLYVYDTVSGEDLSKFLFALDFTREDHRGKLRLNKRKVCRLAGIDEGMLNRWINGQRPVPHWFILIVSMWMKYGFGVSRDVAAVMIREDHSKPGELYPFKQRVTADEIDDALAWLDPERRHIERPMVARADFLQKQDDRSRRHAGGPRTSFTKLGPGPKRTFDV